MVGTNDPNDSLQTTFFSLRTSVVCFRSIAFSHSVTCCCVPVAIHFRLAVSLGSSIETCATSNWCFAFASYFGVIRFNWCDAIIGTPRAHFIFLSNVTAATNSSDGHPTNSKHFDSFYWAIASSALLCVMLPGLEYSLNLLETVTSTGSWTIWNKDSRRAPNDMLLLSQMDGTYSGQADWKCSSHEHRLAIGQRRRRSKKWKFVSRWSYAIDNDANERELANSHLKCTRFDAQRSEVEEKMILFISFWLFRIFDGPFAIHCREWRAQTFVIEKQCFKTLRKRFV